MPESEVQAMELPQEVHQVQMILSSMQRSLECRICLDLFKNPAQTKCGHAFCTECLHQLTKKPAPCPLCKTRLTRRSFSADHQAAALAAAVRRLIVAVKEDCGFNVSPSKYRPRPSIEATEPAGETRETASTGAKECAKNVRVAAVDESRARGRRRAPPRHDYSRAAAADDLELLSASQVIEFDGERVGEALVPPPPLPVAGCGRRVSGRTRVTGWLIGARAAGFGITDCESPGVTRVDRLLEADGGRLARQLQAEKRRLGVELLADDDKENREETVADNARRLVDESVNEIDSAPGVAGPAPAGGKRFFKSRNSPGEETPSAPSLAQDHTQTQTQSNTQTQSKEADDEDPYQFISSQRTPPKKKKRATKKTKAKGTTAKKASTVTKKADKPDNADGPSAATQFDDLAAETESADRRRAPPRRPRAAARRAADELELLAQEGVLTQSSGADSDFAQPVQKRTRRAANGGARARPPPAPVTPKLLLARSQLGTASQEVRAINELFDDVDCEQMTPRDRAGATARRQNCLAAAGESDGRPADAANTPKSVTFSESVEVKEIPRSDEDAAPSEAGAGGDSQQVVALDARVLSETTEARRPSAEDGDRGTTGAAEPGQDPPEGESAAVSPQRELPELREGPAGAGGEQEPADAELSPRRLAAAGLAPPVAGRRGSSGWSRLPPLNTSFGLSGALPVHGGWRTPVKESRAAALADAPAPSRLSPRGVIDSAGTASSGDDEPDTEGFTVSQRERIGRRVSQYRHALRRLESEVLALETERAAPPASAAASGAAPVPKTDDGSPPPPQIEPETPLNADERPERAANGDGPPPLQRADEPAEAPPGRAAAVAARRRTDPAQSESATPDRPAAADRRSVATPASESLIPPSEPATAGGESSPPASESVIPATEPAGGVGPLAVPPPPVGRQGSAVADSEEFVAEAARQPAGAPAPRRRSSGGSRLSRAGLNQSVSSGSGSSRHSAGSGGCGSPWSGDSCAGAETGRAGRDVMDQPVTSELLPPSATAADPPAPASPAASPARRLRQPRVVSGRPRTGRRRPGGGCRRLLRRLLAGQRRLAVLVGRLAVAVGRARRWPADHLLRPQTSLGGSGSPAATGAGSGPGTPGGGHSVGRAATPDFSPSGRRTSPAGSQAPPRASLRSSTGVEGGCASGSPQTLREIQGGHTTGSPDTLRKIQGGHTTGTPGTLHVVQGGHTTSSPDIQREIQDGHTTGSPDTLRKIQGGHTTSSPDIQREIQGGRTTGSPGTLREIQGGHTTGSPGTLHEVQGGRSGGSPRTLRETVAGESAADAVDRPSAPLAETSARRADGGSSDAVAPSQLSSAADSAAGGVLTALMRQDPAPVETESAPADSAELAPMSATQFELVAREMAAEAAPSPPSPPRSLCDISTEEVNMYLAVSACGAQKRPSPRARAAGCKRRRTDAETPPAGDRTEPGSAAAGGAAPAAASPDSPLCRGPGRRAAARISDDDEPEPTPPRPAAGDADEFGSDSDDHRELERLAALPADEVIRRMRADDPAAESIGPPGEAGDATIADESIMEVQDEALYDDSPAKAAAGDSAAQMPSRPARPSAGSWSDLSAGRIDPDLAGPAAAATAGSQDSDGAEIVSCSGEPAAVAQLDTVLVTPGARRRAAGRQSTTHGAGIVRQSNGTPLRTEVGGAPLQAETGETPLRADVGGTPLRAEVASTPQRAPESDLIPASPAGTPLRPAGPAPRRRVSRPPPPPPPQPVQGPGSQDISIPAGFFNDSNLCEPSLATPTGRPGQEGRSAAAGEVSQLPSVGASPALTGTPRTTSGVASSSVGAVPSEALRPGTSPTGGVPPGGRRDSGVPPGDRRDSSVPPGNRRDSGVPPRDRRDSGGPSGDRADSGVPSGDRGDSAVPLEEYRADELCQAQPAGTPAPEPVPPSPAAADGDDSEAESEDMFCASRPTDDPSNLGRPQDRSSAAPPQPAPPPPPPPPVIVASGLKRAEQEAVQTLAAAHGGRFLRQWDDAVTHVIVRTGPRLEAGRTLKFLQGVAARAWLLSHNWVADCLAAETLLPEEEYEAIDAATGEPGPRRARLGGGALFAEFVFCCVEPFRDVTLEQLEALIRRSGGAVVRSPDALAAAPAARRVRLIVAQEECEHDFAGWRCRHGVPSVSYEWLIDCVATQRLWSLLDNTLCGASAAELRQAGVPEPLCLAETQETEYFDSMGL